MARPGTLNVSPASAVLAKAELLESDAQHVTALQLPLRESTDYRDARNFAVAESRPASTAQSPAGVSLLAEAPTLNDSAVATRSPTPLSSPRNVSKVQQQASVAALSAAPALRDDASEMLSSNEVAPAPSAKKPNKKVQLARVRPPRNDANVRDGERGGAFDFLPFIGRTILGANWSDQSGRAIAR
jgi:hypothetical protein